MDTNSDDSEVYTYTEQDTNSISSVIADNTDKPLQELTEYDNLDEDKISSLPTYETATRLHSFKPSVPTGLSSAADELQDDAVDNKSLQVLPGYDEIDGDKAAAMLSLPTYEAASKLNTTSLKMKGTSVALTCICTFFNYVIYRSLWYR